MMKHWLKATITIVILGGCTAAWALTSISAYKTFTREILTSADLNATVSGLVTGINNVIAYFPGDTVYQKYVAADTVVAKPGPAINFKDELRSLNYTDSLNFHRGDIERLRADTVTIGAAPAAPTFSFLVTAGRRSKLAWGKIDTLSWVRIDTLAKARIDTIYTAGTAPRVGYVYDFSAGKKVHIASALVDTIATFLMVPGQRATVAYIDPDTLAGAHRITGNPTYAAGVHAVFSDGSSADIPRAQIDSLYVGATRWVIGTTVQAWDTDLDDLASAADAGTGKFVRAIGSDSVNTGSVTASAYMRGASGAMLETNLGIGRRVEQVGFYVQISQAAGLDKIAFLDITGAVSGTSTVMTGGFHTNAATVTIQKSATSAGDQDSNKVFLDTDNNVVRVKKTSGTALNKAVYLMVQFALQNVDVSSIQGILVLTQTADANFTGSPSALYLVLYNSAAAIIDPWSLTSANGNEFDLLIYGTIIY